MARSAAFINGRHMAAGSAEETAKNAAAYNEGNIRQPFRAAEHGNVHGVSPREGRQNANLPQSATMRMYHGENQI
jgi:hypothetical protein